MKRSKGFRIVTFRNTQSNQGKGKGEGEEERERERDQLSRAMDNAFFKRMVRS